MKYLYRRSIAALALVLSSISLHGQTALDNAIVFRQEKQSFTINKEADSISIRKIPFSMEFFCKQYDAEGKIYNAVSVAVLADKDDIGDISIGRNLEDIPYFSPGAGFAAYKEGYTSIYINNEGSHYLFYKDENDKRADLISKHGDLFLLKWNIAAFLNRKTQEDIPLPELKNDYLYFVILMDRNLNQIVDKGEIKVVKILFR